MTPRRSQILLYLAISLGLAGCSSEPKTAAKGPAPSVPVSIATAELKDVPVTLRAIGNVEPAETVGVKSQISGELKQVHFREGEDVNRGDLLFTLDQRQLQAELARAEGNLQRDQAQAKNARVQAERYARLLKEGVIAQQQYDQFVSNADALDATVAADKAAVEYARLQLQYTRIVAPIAGRTGNLEVDRGNIVKANDVNMVTINQVSPVNVQFSIPEQQLAEVKRYLEARTLRVEAITRADSPQTQSAAPVAPITNLPSTGDLTFIDNAVDPATGTIQLKGTFANKDRRLWPGQFVDVVLTLSVERQAVVVPAQAVQTGQQGAYVFVVSSENTADMRQVTVRRNVGDLAVISTGLRPGERVVTDGQLRLTRGAKVEMKAGSPAQTSDPVAPTINDAHRTGAPASTGPKQ
ncbi:MAG TPA: efflux RND transporter periplasmic adaptor subunit [Terriglobales bacterium]|nr:efflux RND transporter periplasmic adaptor subunit [Terriglobales bacterium]